MRIIIILIALGLVFTTPCFAKKSSGAGNGGHDRQQIKNSGHETQYKTTDHMKKTKQIKRDQKNVKKETKDKDAEKIKGLEKQREKKSVQMQKELGKGSEQGQKARQKRKKWYKFWE